MIHSSSLLRSYLRSKSIISRGFATAVGQPASSVSAPVSDTSTFSGNKGLSIKEPLSFEQGSVGRTGVNFQDFKELDSNSHRLGSAAKPVDEVIGLPGLSEGQTTRHYVRLSQQNYGIDTGFYPLGSCTMKFNGYLNENVARMKGFAYTHPFQPDSTLQGAYQVIDELSDWLKTITGMSAVAMGPAAGSHGELCGIMCISEAMKQTGQDHRKIILVPESAHGTNPATAAMCGFKVKEITAGPDGRVDVEDLKRKVNDQVAGLMLTNPNTCGLFEKDIIEITSIIHEAGGYVYLDGANLNAMFGRVKISELGVDAMHMNLHKSMSTPHGGGGPGAGPTVLSERLAPYCPRPMWSKDSEGKISPIEKEEDAPSTSFGRIKPFHGQMGMFTRALAFCKVHGAEGLRHVSGDAVLNANYIKARLGQHMSLAFPNETAMHEVIFSDKFLKGTGVTTMDISKALLDEGYHAPTNYFPLVVHGAMLIEPTESESKETLDQFCDVMISLAQRAKNAKEGEETAEGNWFKQKPVHTPVRRCDEVTAALKPIVTYTQ